MGALPRESHFSKLQTFQADYADANFTQYESQRTGLRVVVVDRKGPKVYGNFAVATEIHDDSGSRMFEHDCMLLPHLTENSTYPRASLLHGFEEVSV